MRAGKRASRAAGGAQAIGREGCLRPASDLALRDDNGKAHISGPESRLFNRLSQHFQPTLCEEGPARKDRDSGRAGERS